MNNHKSADKFSRTIISDIAEKSGVSATTVSRVLHGHKHVSVETRHRVMQYISELGYVQRNGHGVTDLVGLSVPMFNNYFGEMLDGAFESLQARGAQFIMTRSGNIANTEASQVQQMLSQNVSSLIFILPQESKEELLALKGKEIPFVVVDPFMHLPDEIPTIMVENISSSMIVIEHLLSLGHRRIAIITGPPHWATYIDRTAGYYAAMASAGLAIDQALICEGRLTAESGEEVAEHLLSLPEPPTAMFAFNDDMAIGAMHMIHKHGLRVPEDISVVGFDDASSNLAYVVPALTTVRLPLKEIGHLAVDVLYRILQRQPLEAAHIKLSARLIVRDSTGPCKKLQESGSSHPFKK